MKITIQEFADKVRRLRNRRTYQLNQMYLGSALGLFRRMILANKHDFKNAQQSQLRQLYNECVIMLIDNKLHQRDLELGTKHMGNGEWIKGEHRKRSTLAFLK